MKLRITVDPDLCYGAASCVTVSPDHFRLNDENKASVLDHGEDVPPPPRIYDRVIEADDAKRDEIILAAQSCPVSAIAVYNEETGEKLWPLA